MKSAARSRGLKSSKVQIFRRLMLAAVIAFFVWVPASNWYANYKVAYNQARLVGLADGQALSWVYGGLDAFYSLWESPVDAATSNNGSLWAFTLFGVPFSDPLGLIAELLNSVKFPVKYFIGGLIPFAVALVLGRVFCSWLCPMTVLFGITAKIRAFMVRMGFPLMAVRLEPTTRVFVFFGGLILSHVFGAWVWHFVLPYISFTHEIFAVIVFSGFTTGVYFLIAILVLDIGLVPGEYCRSVCPTGLLLAEIGRVRLLTLKADSANCPKGCSMCQKVCPIDLFPKKGELYSCHLCYRCVDNCPKHHIRLGLNPLYESGRKGNPQ